jgi:hypothetical protein
LGRFLLLFFLYHSYAKLRVLGRLLTSVLLALTELYKANISGAFDYICLIMLENKNLNMLDMKPVSSLFYKICSAHFSAVLIITE